MCVFFLSFVWFGGGPILIFEKKNKSKSAYGIDYWNLALVYERVSVYMLLALMARQRVQLVCFILFLYKAFSSLFLLDSTKTKKLLRFNFVVISDIAIYYLFGNRLHHRFMIWFFFCATHQQYWHHDDSHRFCRISFWLLI